MHPQESEKTHTELFPLLWVVAGLFHLISNAEVSFLWSLGARIYPIEQLLLTVCSISYVAGLRSASLFGVILVLQIFGTYLSLPEIPNHVLLAAVVNIGLLVDLIRHRGKLSSEGFSVCRTGALILYLFAAFHKLNSDYLNPEISCSNLFFQQIASDFPIFNFIKINRDLLPILSILTEAAIPLLLLIQKTRIIGVVIAAIFHIFLALHAERHFFDFSSAMLAFVTLFLPLQSTLFNSKITRFLLAICFTITASALLGWPDTDRLILYIIYRNRAWPLFVLIWVVSLILTVHLNSSAVKEKIQIFPKSFLGRTLVTLLFINGTLPYLGLKTRTAFDMYSNLAVEDRRTNHLLVPSSLLGNIFTADLIYPTKAEGTYVRPDVLDTSRRMTRFELVSLLIRKPNLKVVLDGKIAVSSPSEVYSDGWTPNLFLRKMLSFRPVETANTPAKCQW